MRSPSTMLLSRPPPHWIPGSRRPDRSRHAAGIRAGRWRQLQFAGSAVRSRAPWPEALFSIEVRSRSVPGSSVALGCLGIVLSWGSNASLASNLGSLVGPMIDSRWVLSVVGDFVSRSWFSGSWIVSSSIMIQLLGLCASSNFGGPSFSA
jgi:hypothetical protein